METLTCKKANQMDMVSYLATLGYQPEKIRNQDYWYLSPLHKEKTASFKVNRKRNIWYDHALGKGGTLVDFGVLYHGCSISEFLRRLSGTHHTFSFHLPHQSIGHLTHAGEKKEARIVILDTRPIVQPALRQYLKQRNIPLDIANDHCRETDFLLYGKRHTVIGFKNNAGGYELRSEHFKGSSSPKAVREIRNGGNDLVVFEGFFDFLSYCSIKRQQQASLTSCLILNSLAFFEKSRQIMEQYRQVHLMLDRDKPGKQYTQKAAVWNREKYID